MNFVSRFSDNVSDGEGMFLIDEKWRLCCLFEYTPSQVAENKLCDKHKLMILTSVEQDHLHR